MKVLIAYDGSPPADASVEALAHAGLPAVGEVLVLSVSEPWTPVATMESGWTPGVMEQSAIAAGATRLLAENAAEDAAAAARKSSDRAREILPGWDVRAETCCAPASGAILERADAWGPDLLVLGSHGRSAVGRWLLGSTSQSLLVHAHCSVRIGRVHARAADRPLQLLIGYDGSSDARRAVEAVGRRNWPAGTRVKLLSVHHTPPGCGGGESGTASRHLINERASVIASLQQAGLEATAEDQVGDPRHALLQVAHNWPADCLFLGARGTSAIHRLLIGSVSTALAQRAECSVEVVKPPGS